MSVVGQFTRLTSLNLDYTDVSDKGLESLAGLSKLERLSLDSTNVTDVSAKLISSFKQLKELNLYHTLMTDKSFQEIRAAIPACKIICDPLSRDSKRRRS